MLHITAQYASSALFSAACNGRVDCARLLLDAGADKNVTSFVRAQ
jgi:hypothetical protein